MNLADRIAWGMTALCAAYVGYLLWVVVTQ